MHKEVTAVVQVFLGIVGLIISTVIIGCTITPWVVVPVACAALVFAGYIHIRDS